VAKQYSVTYDGYNKWLMPLNLAIGFHLLIAFSIVFLPGMFKSKPRFEDIYTVNLVNIAEQLPEQVITPPAAESPPPVELTKPAPEAVSIAPEPVAPPQPQPVNPVSLKPLKKKIKKTVKPEVNRDLARERDAERLRRQQLAEALRAEQVAAEQARLAAEEAARQQKLLEQQLTQIRQQAQSSPAAPARSGSSGALTILEKQYYTAIINRISQFWALPEFKRWDPSTQAIVVVTIAQNGTITRQFFEKRSDDPVFDQFVSKALQDANPLPPIPPALRKTSFEIGLRFRPGSIN
jgi:colicin import membrane protein